MTKAPLRALAGALVLLCAATGSASADDESYTKDTWPLAVTERPILIPSGMLELRGDTARINFSDDSLGGIGDPIQLAPDLYYGFGSTLNIGIVHRDSGICIAGDLCDKAYNDIGIEALIGFMNKGSFLAAFRAGVRVPSFDNFVAGPEVGLALQLSAGKIQINVDPRLYIGAVGRTPDEMGDAAKKEELDVPVVLWWQAQGQTALFVRSGLLGPLDGFGDSFRVPIGVGASFAANNRLDFGAEFVFGNLAGKDSSADERWLIGRVALRL
jgi:hypothetical protein